MLVRFIYMLIQSLWKQKIIFLFSFLSLIYHFNTLFFSSYYMDVHCTIVHIYEGELFRSKPYILLYLSLILLHPQKHTKFYQLHQIIILNHILSYNFTMLFLLWTYNHARQHRTLYNYRRWFNTTFVSTIK